jgi:hypothetical protein
MERLRVTILSSRRLSNSGGGGLHNVLKDFIDQGDGLIKKWTPDGQGEVYDYIRSLKIPENERGPSLLLHNLGQLSKVDEARISDLL